MLPDSIPSWKLGNSWGDKAGRSRRIRRVRFTVWYDGESERIEAGSGTAAHFKVCPPPVRRIGACYPRQVDALPRDPHCGIAQCGRTQVTDPSPEVDQYRSKGHPHR